MSNSSLPERASLEFLKKLAKDRLKELRRADPRVRLATAQLEVAREYGFPSWRALKAELDKRQSETVARFFEACAKGHVDVVRELLARDPTLSRRTDARGAYGGWTGLHYAAQHGQTEIVRMLLDAGADPNAREAGDNTCPLHWAAAHGHVDIVRALLDADGDVHGIGDVHEMDAIGWATFHHAPGDPSDRLSDRAREVVALLLERGARHHIFSAINTGDLDLIRKVVEENPKALDRRMSRFEQGQTPLHLAMGRKRYDILNLLIDLGADLEATDGRGQTALAVAMLHGDREAMRRLHAAGAKQPPGWELDVSSRRKKPVHPSSIQTSLARLAANTRKGVPAINVPDIAATLDWYTWIGFKELGRYEDDGVVNWGMTSFGKAEVMLGMGGKKQDRQDVSLWIYTDKVDDLYQLFKSRQLAAAQAALAGEPGADQGIEFLEDIYNPFYGGRQFSIRDLNGYALHFYQD